MSSVASHPAPAAESRGSHVHADRLDSLLRGRGSVVQRLVFRFGGPGRTFAVGSRDMVLGALGLLVALVVVALMWPVLVAHEASGLPAAVWFGLLRVVALLWPVRVAYDRYVAELSLDTAILTYWLVSDVPAVAVLCWIVASAAAELLRCHVIATGAINLGISSVSALAGAAVYASSFRLVSSPEATIVPCVAAAWVYVLVDHLLTVLVMGAMGERLTLSRMFGPAVWLAVLVTTALAGLGWAMAHLDAGGLVGGVVLATAMGLMIVLTSVITSMADDRARLRHIVSFLHRMPSFPDDATALREIEATARELAGTSEVVVRPWPPASARREVGFSLDGSQPSLRSSGTDPQRWLVARIRDLDSRFSPAEEAALETLSFVAGDGLALRRAAGETRWLATHDTLTRLANRTRLLDAMAAAEQVGTGGRGVTSAVVLIDIDGFKAVNDDISHEAGDHVLAVLGPRIAEAVTAAGAPPEGLPSRLGGDEFAVFLPTVHTEDEVQRLCEQIRDRICEPIDWHHRTLHLDASIGFSTGPRLVATSLLREADAAMYLVKHSGKGGIGRYRTDSGDVLV